MLEAEALHVGQQRLVERARAAQGEFVIWDVGLGAAANALAVWNALSGSSRPAAIRLHSFDLTLEPLSFALSHAELLEYIEPHRARLERLRARAFVAEQGIEWTLHLGDFRDQMCSAPKPHAILYDPYSPGTNADLWSLEHFSALAASLDPARPCLLSNYTRSTAVRVTLLLAGFHVGIGAATGDKEETTLATNDLSLLNVPLDHTWLARVRRSTRAAPLRFAASAGPIAEADYAKLADCLQFRSAR
ncbi:MAG: tRNA-guanine transglycosylase [Chthoniobacter sp.]|nr:tRNA-guanine transglycosylase [Chthoniobacter sp.]